MLDFYNVKPFHQTVHDSFAEMCSTLGGLAHICLGVVVVGLMKGEWPELEASLVCRGTDEGGMTGVGG